MKKKLLLILFLLLITWPGESILEAKTNAELIEEREDLRSKVKTGVLSFEEAKGLWRKRIEEEKKVRNAQRELNQQKVVEKVVSVLEKNGVKDVDRTKLLELLQGGAEVRQKKLNQFLGQNLLRRQAEKVESTRVKAEAIKTKAEAAQKAAEEKANAVVLLPLTEPEVRNRISALVPKTQKTFRDKWKAPLGPFLDCLLDWQMINQPKIAALWKNEEVRRIAFKMGIRTWSAGKGMHENPPFHGKSTWAEEDARVKVTGCLPKVEPFLR